MKTPGDQALARVPQIRRYQQWLDETRGLRFDSYDALWQWSVDDLDAFWRSVWAYMDIQSPHPVREVLVDERMPGARWFPGVQLNYARQALRHAEQADAAGVPALVSENEQGAQRTVSWPELRRQVASLALELRALGIGPGDRVVACLPNVPETVIAFLACASLGAVWSLCAPDMGTQAIVDRFRQIQPRVLIAAGSVFYAGRPRDLGATVAALREALPTVEHVFVTQAGEGAPLPGSRPLAEALAHTGPQVQAFEPVWVDFDHPLWVVYSSGTTGLPKPIVHGHGGIVLTSLVTSHLHNDLGASYLPQSFGERFHWYSSTGWVMWNAQVAGLLVGTTLCLYDGSPSGTREQPDWGVLWRFAARHRVSFFGAGAAFYTGCMKAGLDFAQAGDLSAVHTLGCTGSPLPAEVQRWGSEQFQALQRDGPALGRLEPVQPPLGGSGPRAAGARGGGIWWCNLSGGTDFCGAFIGGHRELPQTPGLMQCRQLGCSVQAWSDEGQPLVGEVGELVCTRPIPSMPLYLWGDTDDERYRASYFSTFPGVWRHGDWLRVHANGACEIVGRSDATLNRHGLRLGSSEIYAAVEALPQVRDSMVVDLEVPGQANWLALFVVLGEGVVLDDTTLAAITGAIRQAVSPRFVPDAVYAVPQIPRTTSGKKLEVPIKRLLLGQQLEAVLSKGSVADVQSLDWFMAFARQRHNHRAPSEAPA